MIQKLMPKLPEKITRSRVLNWVSKGSLIFVITLVMRIGTTKTAVAADPTGADTLLGSPGAPVDRVCHGGSRILPTEKYS